MKLKDFIEEIGIQEFKSVLGKWGSNISFLILILFISLIAMGIAQGSLNYLQKKMNDPFMQFVDVDHRWDGAVQGYDKFNKIVADNYKADNNKQVKEVFETYVKSTRFFYENQKDGKTKEGFILETNNEFYKSLIKKDMVLSNNNSFHDNQWGVIITENFMNQLEIDLSTPYINIEKGNTSFPVPICAVVERLRNNKEFIMSKKLYSLLYGSSEKIPILKTDTAQGVKRWFIPKLKELPSELLNKGVVVSNIYSEQSLTHVSGLMVESSDFSIELDVDGVVRVYDYDVRDINIEQHMGAPDTYTFLFNNPDDVIGFSNWLYDNYGIQLEQSRIEAKKNFGFFQKLSQLLSFAIIVFSIISIIFFIINLLLFHIEKNKRNLGTLKAFGLPNKYIILLYSSITFSLVTISFISSYVLSSIFGQLLLRTYISLKGINPENYLNFVTFNNRDFGNTFLFFVFIPTIIIIFKLYKYLNNVTPGDLIYERK